MPPGACSQSEWKRHAAQCPSNEQHTVCVLFALFIHPQLPQTETFPAFIAHAARRLRFVALGLRMIGSPMMAPDASRSV
jgi:hypothetical protein